MRKIPLSIFGRELEFFRIDYGYTLTEIADLANVPYPCLQEARRNDYARTKTQQRVRAFMEETKNSMEILGSTNKMINSQ